MKNDTIVEFIEYNKATERIAALGGVWVSLLWGRSRGRFYRNLLYAPSSELRL